jgi:hypothetical protein
VPYPPPPPPPTISSFVPLLASSDNAGHVPLPELSAIQEKLDREREQLRDFQGEMIGSRFRLSAQRQQLRNLQIETGAKAGSVFNLCRQYLHENNIQLPHSTEQEFNKVSSLRDKLGLLEAEYDEAEANYNTMEWNYSRKETRFVDDLLYSKFEPVGIPNRSRSMEDLETAELTRFAGERPIDWTGPGLHGTNLETRITNTVTTPKETLDAIVALSESALIDPRPDNAIRSADKDNSRSFPHTRSDWHEKIKHIDDWLLGMLEDTPLQRAQLKAMYCLDYLDDESWWEQVKQHWHLDEEDVPAFHTGDSTASRHISDSTVNLIYSDALAIKVGDVESNAPESAEIPIGVESESSLEDSNQTQTSPKPPLGTIDETTNSVSTSQSPSRRTSCSNETKAESDTTSHHSCTCKICASRDNALPFERRIEGVAPNTEAYQASESAPATPTQHGQDEDTAISPDLRLDSYKTPLRTQGENSVTSEDPAASQQSENLSSGQSDGLIHGSDANDSNLSRRQSETSPKVPSESSNNTNGSNHALQLPYLRLKSSATSDSVLATPPNDHQCLVM